MTTATPFGDSTAAAMLRGGLVPTGLVAVVCIVISAFVAGSTGLWGAVLGAAMVIVFFTLSLVVLGAARRIDPMATLLIALALYAAKVIALGVALIVLNLADLVGDPFHRTALGVTIIACTLVWTVGEIVAATRRRELLYDLREATP